MAANTAVGPQISLKFEYDAKGAAFTSRSGPTQAWSGNPTNDLTFVYDGWNLLAVLAPPSSVLQSFLWGLDLSGSEQGAGGVGGLLEVNDVANGVSISPPSTATGTLRPSSERDRRHDSAVYEYGPFGELLRATGPMAKANPLPVLHQVSG